MFTPIWGRFPIWLIFFRWVETTNRFSWSYRNHSAQVPFLVGRSFFKSSERFMEAHGRSQEQLLGICFRSQVRTKHVLGFQGWFYIGLIKKRNGLKYLWEDVNKWGSNLKSSWYTWAFWTVRAWDSFNSKEWPAWPMWKKISEVLAGSDFASTGVQNVKISESHRHKKIPTTYVDHIRHGAAYGGKRFDGQNPIHQLKW